MRRTTSWTRVGLAGAAGAIFWAGIAGAGWENAWEKVQDILTNTQDIVVLDGTEKAPLRYPETAAPAYGDWMVRHQLSDPQNFNPYTSSDAGASRVLAFIIEFGSVQSGG